MLVLPWSLITISLKWVEKFNKFLLAQCQLECQEIRLVNSSLSFAGSWDTSKLGMGDDWIWDLRTEFPKSARRICFLCARSPGIELKTPQTLMEVGWAPHSPPYMTGTEKTKLPEQEQSCFVSTDD
jgi:hypothetical protein